jgi:(1->4)-alpha-D-glucan 1-alpha-D-glucosylmutase
MSVFTTHDLPTLRGWWRGLDIDLRERLGVFDAARAGNERAGRLHDVQMFCVALNEEGLIQSAEPPTEPPLDAAVRYIARAMSALTAIQFEDAADEINQANLPGLNEGHPNWRRRLSKTVEELTAPDGQLARWAGLMKDEGRGR